MYPVCEERYRPVQGVDGVRGALQGSERAVLGHCTLWRKGIGTGMDCGGWRTSKGRSEIKHAGVKILDIERLKVELLDIKLRRGIVEDLICESRGFRRGMNT